MSNQTLRDRNGIKIGEIKSSNGKLVLYDKSGIKLGSYDPQNDITRDSNGIKIGTGNLLTTLL